MYKFSTLLILLLSSVLLLQAQDGSRAALVDLLAQETCTCLSDKEPSEVSRENLEMAVGLCILNSFSDHSDEFPDIELDLGNPRAMERLGEEIGFKMFNYCPSMLMQLAGASGELSDEEMEMMNELMMEPPPPPMDYSTSSNGTLVRIDAGEFSKITIKDAATGEKITLLWLGQFSGDDILQQDSANWKGKSVAFSYDTIDVYNAEKGEYLPKNVIVSMIVLE